jgi:hypothetical protein
MTFTNELRNAFDNIYRLEVKNYYDGYTEMLLTEENARDNTPHIVNIKRTITNDSRVKHEVIDSEILKNSDITSHKKNVKEWIKELINSNPLEYEKFLSDLNDKTGRENDEANIKKILKKLQDENMIDMKGGSTWVGGIRIVGCLPAETNNSPPMATADTLV